MCRVLGVSPSGYYAWRKRGLSRRRREDAALLERVRRIWEGSGRTYGAPRVWAELRAGGVRCSRKRVARLMREAGLVGAYSRRRRRKTTVQDPRAAAAPDLVGGSSGRKAPLELWVADLVYVPTQEGVLYLSVVLDVWSRRVVGWAMRQDARAELVVDALEMALWRRRPAPGLVHHSDRGSQYSSLRFGARLRAARILPSMGRKGDAYDNALCEAFFATLNREVLRRCRFRTREEARSVLFAYLEGLYNRRRRHSALGYLSPEEFERRSAKPASVSAIPAQKRGKSRFRRNPELEPCSVTFSRLESSQTATPIFSSSAVSALSVLSAYLQVPLWPTPDPPLHREQHSVRPKRHDEQHHNHCNDPPRVKRPCERHQ
jgi:putative transposase